MKPVTLALLTTVAVPAAAWAQDPAAASAALTGHRLMVSRSTDPTPVTIALNPGGVAQRIGLHGRTVGGTWVVQGDRVCVTLGQRPQRCMGPVQQLLATGHIDKTSESGVQVSVVLQ
jgi:hypothetical protein